MAHTSSARKRIKQTEKKRMRNKSLKSAMKTSIKKYFAALEEGNKETAAVELQQVTKSIYKTASKGVIHKNQAARRVSRLTSRLNALQA